jgi:asparagine synthase (glutamine-hydrolysing)
MCGIAGIVRWKERSQDSREIERMTKAVKHREPDGDGIFVRDEVVFGHRRLAIIDPQLGQQPMSNQDQSLRTFSSCHLLLI